MYIVWDGVTDDDGYIYQYNYVCSMYVYHICDDGVPEGGVEREVTDELLKWFTKFWGRGRRGGWRKVKRERTREREGLRKAGKESEEESMQRKREAGKER